jgi:pilus assembly protein CpaC
MIKEVIKKIHKIEKHVVIAILFSMTFLLPLNAKDIQVDIDGAELIKFGEDVSEIFIANPDIADVQLSNKTTAYVFGKSTGSTKFFAMNSKGKEVFNAQIIVGANLTNLKQLIAAYDPHELVEVTAIPGGILLEGPVDSPKIAEDIRSLAASYLKSAPGVIQGTTSSTSGGSSNSSGGPVVINRLTIKPPVQVNLRVKVAEVARNVVNEFGVNWQDVIGNTGQFKFGALGNRAPFTDIPIATNDVTSIFQKTVPSGVDNISAIGFGFRNGNLDLNAALDLLSKEGLVTILAEPNLVAVSGETATFLAGGEFPYPIPQDFGNITIQFKQYGVSLSFTPTVLDGNLISMRVRPEVSELDPLTGISVFGQNVPGILTRRAETTVQLGSGQTFAIAGLLKNTVRSQIEAIPGLGDLPVLGALFRSNAFNRGDTELVILVTPFLVEPSSGKEMQLPTDGLNYATFVEQILERRLVKQTPQKGQAPAFGPGGVRLVGPAGFSVE